MSTIEKLKGLERKVTLTIPSETIESDVQARLKKLANKAKLDGFRPGKVPLNVLEKRFGKEVRYEVTGDVLNKSFQKAMEENEVRLAGVPRFDMPESTPGQPFTVSITFEVFPEVKIVDFGKVKIEKPLTEVNDADVERAIERIKQQRSDWKETKESAQKGDRLTVDYKAFVKKKEIESESQQDVVITIGDDMMFEGFEDGLIGTKAGEEKELKLKFPKDFYEKQYQGKGVVYNVTVKKVEKADQPELDEAFIQSLGAKSKTLEELKKEIRTNLEREAKYGIRRVLRKRVFDKLYEMHDFLIPSTLVERESEGMRQQQMQYFKSINPNANIPEIPLDTYKERAERQVKLGLLLAEIVQTNKLQPDEAMVEARLDDMAAIYDDKEQAKQWLKGNKNQMQQLMNEIVEDQVVDLVLKSAKIVEKSTDYDELIKLAHQQ
ncbi:MAG: trigger factor [Gammaproteobacteria bacterium]